MCAPKRNSRSAADVFPLLRIWIRTSSVVVPSPMISALKVYDDRINPADTNVFKTRIDTDSNATTAETAPAIADTEDESIFPLVTVS